MKVLLRKSQPNLGKKGDVVEVKDGYARNYLIPENLAVLATKGAIADVNLSKAKEVKGKKELAEKSDEIKKLLADKTIEIKEKAAENGKLFGSVGTADIAKAISKEIDLKIPEDIVNLDKDIKKAGEHKVEIELDKDTKFSVNIKISPEE